MTSSAIEQRLAAIVEGCDDAIVEIGLDGRIRHANPAVRALFGYEPDELVGEDVAVLVPPDQVPEVTGAMLRVATGRSTDALTTTWQRKDGQLLDTSLRLSPVRDSAGTVVGVSGISRDVSAQLATMAQLTASEQRFRARFHDSPMPQAMIDPQGRLESVNEALCTLLGRTGEDLVAMPIADLTHPSDSGSADERLNAILGGVRDADTWERIAARPDGSALPVLVHAALLRHADGEPYAVATFVQDLTALRQAERALRRRESLFTAVVDHAADWVFVIDATGRLLFISDTLASTLGYRPAALVGSDGWKLVHPDDRSTVRAAVEATVDTGERSEDVVFRVLDRGGSWRWVEHAFTNRLADPDIAGIVSNGHDVTARLEAEQALRESEVRHRGVADVAQEGIWAFDWSGRTLHANQKLADILGLTLPQIDQLTVPALLDGDGLLLVAQKLRDSHEPGAEEHELSYQHPDGGVRNLHLRIAPLDGHAGPVGSLAKVSDVTDATRVAAELRQRVLYDELTGLPNRTLLCERLRQALLRSRSCGRSPVSVLFADLDQFQLVNDSWGHATGDRLLAEVAQRLTSTVAATATVARFGGDGFVVVSEDTEQAQAQQIADDIQRALAEPFDLVGQRLHVTASIGIASSGSPGDSGDAHELLQFADAAMHSAKTRGCGHVVAFDLTVAEEAAARLSLGNDLRDALDDDQLDLHYQPIVELGTGRVLGVEALARWHHPERGHIAPAEFIGVAESQGLAQQLDSWALRRACRDMAVLRRHLEPTATVSVNVSAQHLAGNDLEATVVEALRGAGVPAEALVLEITESAAMHDPTHARQLLDRLRSLGVAVAIDDFGTGYSSLAYLKQLPAESLKIDRAFIEHIADDPDAFAVATAIVDLARATRLRTVAEGVETTEQLKLLRRLGCAAGQGYLWSRALPLDQLVKKLKQLPHGLFDVHTRRGLAPSPPGRSTAQEPEVSVGHGRHRLLQLHNEGASLNTIAAALNSEGYRTPHGQRWHRTTVARTIARIAQPELSRPAG